MLLRIDDTDPARNVPGGEEEILRDLEWLGLEWDEGPVRQSERRERHLEAAAPLGERFDGTTLVREDGTPTYHLASVVDDVDFGITHVIRGNDHRPNEALHRRLFEALGASPPEFVHHGLILGEDGKKLSKRAEGATVGVAARGRDPGARPCAATSRSSACRGTTSTTTCRGSGGSRSRRSRRCPTRSWPPRVGAPAELVPALRGARDLNEARDYAQAILERRPASAVDAPETLERFRELLGERERPTRARPRAEGGRRRPPRVRASR